MPDQLTILFIGSNPSQKASSNEAFTADTVSGRILRGWIEGIPGTILFENITSQKTRDNRPLNQNEKALARVSLLERINRINPDRLVALGKVATEMLTSLNLKFHEMPHPSGLNRKLNDKAYVRTAVDGLAAYCR